MAKRDDVENEVERRSIGREILQDAAKEMGFVVNSIRQEVVEKPWFGDRVTPAVFQEWSRDSGRDSSTAGPQDFSKEASREDLYGRDGRSPSREDLYGERADWDNVRDIEQERHRNPLDDARWESTKSMADDLYGRDRDRDIDR